MGRNLDDIPHPNPHTKAERLYVLGNDRSGNGSKTGDGTRVNILPGTRELADVWLSGRSFTVHGNVRRADPSDLEDKSCYWETLPREQQEELQGIWTKADEKSGSPGAVTDATVAPGSSRAQTSE